VKFLHDYVDNLPLTENPEIFGMHENANIVYQEQMSAAILEVVLSVQPRVSGSGDGKTPEEIVLELAQGFDARVPELLSRENSHPTAFIVIQETGMLESLGTCLTMEFARFNGLIAQLKSSLFLLQRALQGLIVMSGDLDAMYGAFLDNKVPKNWTDAGVGYPSLRPLASWYTDMVSRVEFFTDWIQDGKPYAYWISAFYFPQGFLTSVMQQYSRANLIPVDVLTLAVAVEDFDDPHQLEEGPEEGIYIYGMFMDACGWDYDSMTLCEQEPAVMHVNCPVIHLVPLKNYTADPSKYKCPFYKTSVRAGTLSTTGHSTNFVMYLELDTEQAPAFWVLQGAALLSQLNH